MSRKPAVACKMTTLPPMKVNQARARNQVTRHLEERKIATRLLFGGNVTRQPAYQDTPRRIAAPLTNSDFVMNQVFWIGVFPGLTPAMIEYVLEVMHAIPRLAAAAR